MTEILVLFCSLMHQNALTNCKKPRQSICFDNKNEIQKLKIKILIEKGSFGNTIENRRLNLK
jgi:hypothetical protein